MGAQPVRHFTAVVTLASAILCFASIRAQEHPDFSGTWTLDPSKTVMTGGPARAGGPITNGTGHIIAPQRTKNVNPIYPDDAKRANVAGIVMIEATISPEGKVADAKVVMSIPLLDQAALDAVRQWEYSPTLLNNVPVPIIMTVTVIFILNKQGVRVPETPGMPVGPATMARSNLTVTITQDARAMTLTRDTPSGHQVTVYHLDPKDDSTLGRPGSTGTESVYSSRWDGAKLVTAITSSGPAGARERTETRYLDGETMVVETVEQIVPGSDPLIQKQIYTRVPKLTDDQSRVAHPRR